MSTRRTESRRLAAAALISLASLAAGCEGPAGIAGRDVAASGPATSETSGTLKGAVTVDGSSTVLPLSKLVAREFQAKNPGVLVSLASSGTGGGLKKLCAGQVDLAGASRPINAAETEQCRAAHVDFVELPLAFDSISVVVHPSNTFVACLTVAELKRIWEPAAQGTVTRWSQVRPGFPDTPLTLFAPGGDSGTFDYFTLAIVGSQSSSRRDVTTSEDDGVLVEGVAGNTNSLGYFGYDYYAANRDKLKLVSIDGGRGCVAPSVASVAENDYQPLSRPIFIYASRTALARPEVKALARSYVAPESARFAMELGDVPLPLVTLLSVGRRLEREMTGSVFGGQGAVLGVTAESFRDEDRIQSALVR